MTQLKMKWHTSCGAVLMGISAATRRFGDRNPDRDMTKDDQTLPKMTEN